MIIFLAKLKRSVRLRKISKLSMERVRWCNNCQTVVLKVHILRNGSKWWRKRMT